MEINWLYLHSEHSADHDLFTVGFYAPDGKWHPESDHSDREAAANRVQYLNGGASIVLTNALQPFKELAYECLYNSNLKEDQTVYAYNKAKITMQDLRNVLSALQLNY